MNEDLGFCVHGKWTQGSISQVKQQMVSELCDVFGRIYIGLLNHLDI